MTPKTRNRYPYDLTEQNSFHYNSQNLQTHCFYKIIFQCNLYLKNNNNTNNKIKRLIVMAIKLTLYRYIYFIYRLFLKEKKIYRLESLKTIILNEIIFPLNFYLNGSIVVEVIK